MSFRLALLKHANAAVDANVRETGGANKGLTVEHYQRSVGSEAGEPWCASAVSCWMQEAAMELHPAMKGDYEWAKTWLKLRFPSRASRSRMSSAYSSMGVSS